MNILFLSTWFPYPPDNGSKIRVYHLLRTLAQHHEVTLLSFAFDTARPEEDQALADWGIAVRTVAQDPYRDRLAHGLRFLSPSPVVTWPLPEMKRSVENTLAKARYEVVIASTGVMATYALMAPYPCVRILEEHNSLTRLMWERHQAALGTVQKARTWVSWRKTRHYEARLFRRFDLVTMVSEQDRTACMELVGDEVSIVTVPNGVDCEHNRPDSYARRPNTLVYNGALTYSANYDAMHYFLESIFPRIKAQLPDASLTITGSTQGVDLAGLRLGDGVHLSGYVADIRPVVGGAGACVVPLRQGGGTRLKILEAMALGTPVVSTTKGAEGLEVVDGDHLLLADDPQDFAEATVRLLQDDALRRRLTANARRLVEACYDWSAIGARFVRLVEEAVGCPPTRRRDIAARER